MPKVKRNGQAVVLSENQLAALFATLAQPSGGINTDVLTVAILAA